MNKKFTKVLAAVLAAAMVIPAMSGCGSKEDSAKEGKTVIRVGYWPGEEDPRYESMEATRKAFMEKYPDIYVEGDQWGYNTESFMQKANAGQLPTVFNTWFTEVNKIMDTGYVADLTDAMTEYGYVDAMNPMLLEFVTTDDGRIYGVPWDGYAQGLYINKDLFKKAGLVNEDGSVKIPDTYEQLAEYAATIKEKTGAAGFVIPNAGNCGGWHLMNIAWSNGVEFVEEQADGSWKATFDSPEFKKTLEWLYDMKWNKDALPVDTGVAQGETYKLFAIDQAAMMFGNPPLEQLTQTFEMSADNIVCARMPEGTTDRASQMGGNLYMVSSDATPEQIDAVFKWLEYNGVSPVYTEEQIKVEKEKYKVSYENNGIVLPQDAFDIWVSPERVQKNVEMRKEFVNINPADYETYFGFEGVTIRPEVPVCCQELYAILDRAVQEIETNKDVDIPAMITELQNDWQVNHLDKMN